MLSKIIKDDLKKIYSNFSEELKNLEGKSIFFTGGGGFIGSYLVDIFAQNNKNLEKPTKITIMNKNPMKKGSRLDHLLDDPYFKFISGDVGKPFKISKETDIIFHAASRSNPSQFIDNPLDTLDANINGTRTLLEHSKKNPVENFILFSSGEIYGNPLPEFVPTPETYFGNIDCLHPTSCYTESKRISENLGSIFFKKWDVPVKIPRILLAYGPGMRDEGKVISDFYMDAKKNKKISIRDAGEDTRNFCYVSDIVEGILDVMFKGKSGEPYNVANDKEKISIKNLAYKISNLFDEEIEIKTNPNALKKIVYGIPTRHLDISKIRELGFEPKVSLEEGLLRLKNHEKETGYL